MIHASDFQDATKYLRDRLPDVPECPPPPPSKHDPDDLERIELPRPEKLPKASF